MTGSSSLYAYSVIIFSKSGSWRPEAVGSLGLVELDDSGVQLLGRPVGVALLSAGAGLQTAE